MRIKRAIDLKLHRCLSIYLRAQHSMVTTKELSKEHGVTERTILRDLNALDMAGVPLYKHRNGNDNFWRIME